MELRQHLPIQLGGLKVLHPKEWIGLIEGQQRAECRLCQVSVRIVGRCRGVRPPGNLEWVVGLELSRSRVHAGYVRFRLAGRNIYSELQPGIDLCIQTGPEGVTSEIGVFNHPLVVSIAPGEGVRDVIRSPANRHIHVLPAPVAGDQVVPVGTLPVLLGVVVERVIVLRVDGRVVLLPFPQEAGQLGGIQYVGLFELRDHLNGRGGVETDRRLTLPTPFGGNDDKPVAGPATVERLSRGVPDDADRFNVVRIDQAEEVIVLGVIVAEGDAVDHDQGGIVAGSTHAAQQQLGPPVRPTRSGTYLHPRYLSGQGLVEAIYLQVLDLLTRHLVDGPYDVLPFAFPVGDHDDLLQGFTVIGKAHVQTRPSIHRHRPSLVAHVAKYDPLVLRRDVQGEVPVDIRQRSRRRIVFRIHADPDQGDSVIVSNGTRKHRLRAEPKTAPQKEKKSREPATGRPPPIVKMLHVIELLVSNTG